MEIDHGTAARADASRSGHAAGGAIFAVWVLGAIGVTILQPGFLLETATAGIAGALLWSAVRVARPTRRVLALAVGCALLALVNTWPARVYHAAWESRSILLAAVLSMSSLIVAMLAVGVRPRVQPRRSLLAATGVLGIASAVTSSSPLP